MEKEKQPVIMVAFGATGDLMRLKVIPALYELFKKGNLPRHFRVIGFSHRDLTTEGFDAHVREVIEHYAGKKVSQKSLSSFLKLFEFQRGEFDQKESYESLNRIISKYEKEWGKSANKLFYLSVAPHFYETICRELSRVKLTHSQISGGVWTHIIEEKPFGSDLKSALKIDNLLGKYFKESQIYRLDHYLAKEMLQNISVFRFSNNLFERGWGKDLIERIEIRLLENIGVEKRGPSYDKMGALRDVGQSHFLQILALLTMGNPKKMDALSIRASRARALEALNSFSLKDVKRNSFRAQYRGYREIGGVDPKSNSETYFKIKAHLTSSTWKNVPVIMEGGKRLGKPLKEIVITFRHTTPCHCPPLGHHTNRLIIRLEPKEEMVIEVWAKKPGISFETRESSFRFLLRERETHTRYTEEYTKLLSDAMKGDQTLFLSHDEVKAMWKFVDPILKGWKKNAVPLYIYEPDTREVVEKAEKVM